MTLEGSFCVRVGTVDRDMYGSAHLILAYIQMKRMYMWLVGVVFRNESDQVAQLEFLRTRQSAYSAS